MNKIAYYKEKGLSLQGARAINLIVGCILGSHLDSAEKRDLSDFMRDLEDYLEDDEERE